MYEVSKDSKNICNMQVCMKLVKIFVFVFTTSIYYSVVSESA